MPSTPDEIATAYHEAGHAVTALALGRSIQKVTVRPDERRLGWCELKKGAARPSRDELEREILILLGGMAAEARQTGTYDLDAASHDLRDVRMLAKQRASRPQQTERLERRLLDKAEHLLDQPGIWDAVERIAGELLQHTTISGRAARHHFDQAVAEAER